MLHMVNENWKKGKFGKVTFFAQVTALWQSDTFFVNWRFEHVTLFDQMTHFRKRKRSDSCGEVTCLRSYAMAKWRVQVTVVKRGVAFSISIN